jgi:streptogramin lyase
VRRALASLLLLALTLGVPGPAAAGWRMEILGGSGVGDGRPATEVVLRPSDVAVGDAGELYVMDLDHDRLRVIDLATGIIRTAAGNGRASTYQRYYAPERFCGDDGPADLACLAGEIPVAWGYRGRIARDVAGAVLLTDPGNGRLRRIAPDGTIDTLAGVDGEPGAPCRRTRTGRRRPGRCLGLTTGVAVDGRGGVLVTGDGQILRAHRRSGALQAIAGTNDACWPPATGTSAALGACLPGPLSLASAPDGSVWIAALQGGLYRLDVATGALTNVIPGPFGCPPIVDGQPATAACLSASDVAVDAGGDVFVADVLHVYRVDAATSTIARVAGNGFVHPTTEEGGYCGDDGPARDACLWLVNGVDVDAAGNLFIADMGNSRVRRVDAASGVITTVAGADVCECDDAARASDACLSPRALGVDPDGRILVSAGNRVCRIDAEKGTLERLAGSGGDAAYCGDGGPARAACLLRPQGVAADDSGNVLVADGTNRIRRIDAESGVITTIAGSGEDPYSPVPCSGEDGPALATCLAGPSDVAVAPDGALFVADTAHRRTRRLDPTTGTFATLAHGGRPRALTFEPTGPLLLVDEESRTIRRLASPVWTYVAGVPQPPWQSDVAGIGGPADAAFLGSPDGVAPAPNGDVYFTDARLGGLLRVDAERGLLHLVAESWTIRDVVVADDAAVVVADTDAVRRLVPSDALRLDRFDVSVEPSVPPGLRTAIGARFEATLADASVLAAATESGLDLHLIDSEGPVLDVAPWYSMTVAASECRSTGRERLRCRRAGSPSFVLRLERARSGGGVRLRGSLAASLRPPTARRPIGLVLAFDRGRVAYQAAVQARGR